MTKLYSRVTVLSLNDQKQRIYEECSGVKQVTLSLNESGNFSSLFLSFYLSFLIIYIFLLIYWRQIKCSHCFVSSLSLILNFFFFVSFWGSIVFSMSKCVSLLPVPFSCSSWNNDYGSSTNLVPSPPELQFRSLCLYRSCFFFNNLFLVEISRSSTNLVPSLPELQFRSLCMSVYVLSVCIGLVSFFNNFFLVEILTLDPVLTLFPLSLSFNFCLSTPLIQPDQLQVRHVPYIVPKRRL